VRNRPVLVVETDLEMEHSGYDLSGDTGKEKTGMCISKTKSFEFLVLRGPPMWRALKTRPPP
jgi:hypothetical protein